MKFIYGILSFLFLGCFLHAHSQYYYTDIVAMKGAQQQYAALQNSKTRLVTAISFNGNQPAEDFSLEQRISADGRTIIMTSSDASSGTNTIVNTYDNGRLVMTRDSTANLKSITRYTYDGSGNITLISTVTDDAFMNSHSEEKHIWTYNGNLPEKMLAVKNNSDTTYVSFTYDNNNVAGETWKHKGRVTESYYFYYNDNNQLTDIVRMNMRVNKMLPDFLFEYDSENRVVQMTQIPNGSSDYMIWKYVYNSNGLKERELLFNKQKQLVGRVEYKYN